LLETAKHRFKATLSMTVTSATIDASYQLLG